MSPITIDDIEVQVKLSSNPKILAQASVRVLGVVVIHGFTIQESQEIDPLLQEKIWIQPPRIRQGFTWKVIAFLEDKLLWQALEEKIYNAYKSVKANVVPDILVDVNDIPF